MMNGCNVMLLLRGIMLMFNVYYFLIKMVHRDNFSIPLYSIRPIIEK